MEIPLYYNEKDIELIGTEFIEDYFLKLDWD